jgi:hypothetical protein
MSQSPPSAFIIDLTLDDDDEQQQDKKQLVQPSEDGEYFDSDLDYEGHEIEARNRMRKEEKKRERKEQRNKRKEEKNNVKRAKLV